MYVIVGLLALLLFASLGIIYWQGQALQEAKELAHRVSQEAKATPAPQTQEPQAPPPEKSEEKLADEKRLKRLRSLVNATPDGIIVVDARGTIELLNPDASYTFSYIPGELQGRDIRCLLPTPDAFDGQDFRERFMREHERASSGYRKEMEGIRKDGELVQVEVSIGEIKIPGTQRLYTCIIRDITERKKIERMRQEMMSLVSHDLRDPLAAISGALRLMNHKAEERLAAQDLKMLQIANRNSDRLIRLINSLLEMEMLDVGTLEIPVGAVSISKVVNKAINALSTELEHRSIEVVFHNGHPKAAVVANEQRLQQVLGHLLTNAVEASANDDKIEVDVQRHDDHFTISVSDNGPGIPEELQERMFERFTRGDNPDRGSKGGAGLGLCISKALIEKFGGNITFETEQEAGTTFRFTLLEADLTMKRLLKNAEEGTV